MPDAEVKILSGRAALSRAAAEHCIAMAQKAIAQRGRFLVALSGGSTPEGMFDLLRRSPYATAVPWAHVHVFWGDERLVPPTGSGSNFYQAERLMLSFLPVPAPQVHRIRGELDPQTAVADYTTQLRQTAEPGRDWPRFDLVFLGLGSDGHTASLFPGPPHPDETRHPVISVQASYDDRPAQRITLTPLVFNDARQVTFLVAGEDKAAALTGTLHGAPDPQKWPAQRIRPYDGSQLWLVDEAAGARFSGSV